MAKNTDYDDLPLKTAYDIGCSYMVSAETLSLNCEQLLSNLIEHNNNNTDIQALQIEVMRYVNKGENLPEELGERFYNAVKRNDENSSKLAEKISGQRINAHIFECLSTEILLKGLVQHFNGSYKRSHSLVELFESLPKECCSRIAMNYDGDVSLDNLLADVNNRFVNWRYQQQIYDNMKANSFTNLHVNKLPKLISSIVKEYRLHL